METRIESQKLSDGSEAFNLLVELDDGSSILFACVSYAAARNLQQAIGETSGVEIF